MKFVLKKIAGLIIALLIVSVLAFLAFEVIPGDPARSIPVSYTHLDVYKRQVYNKDSARMVLCRADL